MTNIFSLPQRDRLYLVKGKGDKYLGLCPFHAPKDTLGLPTLKVDYGVGLYECPECDQKGAIQLLSKKFIIHTDSNPTLKEVQDRYNIKIDSRYDVDGETEAAKRAYLIMLPALRTWIDKIFIDSKSQYTFVLTFKDLPCVQNMAMQVMDDFASCLIFVNDGCNGVYGEAANGEDLGEISANWIEPQTL